jgi:hypothetical protein
MSVLTVTAMLILFVHELYRFLKPRTFEEIVVDTSRVGLQRTMQITFNLSIHSPCSQINLEVYDYEGNSQTEGKHEVHKQRIDENGLLLKDKEWVQMKQRQVKSRKDREVDKTVKKDYCGSCYNAGSKGQCCNSCDDVIEAHRAKGYSIDGLDRWQQCIDEGYADLGKETCNMFGNMRVSRVQGVFLFTMVPNVRPGEKKTHDISRVSKSMNLTHTVNYLEFGPQIPSAQHPLDGLTVMQRNKGHFAFKYHLQVVPTRWLSSRGFEVNTYKFSPAFSQKNITERISRDVPGIYFYYDIAPISVISREVVYSVWQFVTSVCAIVGGAFTCAALADQLLFKALTTVEGKRRIGKD